MFGSNFSLFYQTKFRLKWRYLLYNFCNTFFHSLNVSLLLSNTLTNYNDYMFHVMSRELYHIWGSMVSFRIKQYDSIERVSTLMLLALPFLDINSIPTYIIYIPWIGMGFSHMKNIYKFTTINNVPDTYNHLTITNIISNILGIVVAKTLIHISSPLLYPCYILSSLFFRNKTHKNLSNLKIKISKT